MTPEQIDELIARYGRPAFELAMRQVYIDAVTWTVVALGFLAGAIVLFAIARRQWRARTDSGYDDHELIAALVATVGAGCLVIALLCTPAILALLNPEWAALRKLLPS